MSAKRQDQATPAAVAMYAPCSDKERLNAAACYGRKLSESINRGDTKVRETVKISTKKSGETKTTLNSERVIFTAVHKKLWSEKERYYVELHCAIVEMEAVRAKYAFFNA